MLIISKNLSLPLAEIEIKAIRSQGAGGQHVNKVSTAIHLHFDINKSSLPEMYKERLLNLKDRRISADGIVTIKAQEYRSQKKNKDEALHRLQQLIKKTLSTPKKRIPTKPSKTSRQKRLDRKKKDGRLKALRKRVSES